MTFPPISPLVEIVDRREDHAGPGVDVLISRGSRDIRIRHSQVHRPMFEVLAIHERERDGDACARRVCPVCDNLAYTGRACDRHPNVC